MILRQKLLKENTVSAKLCNFLGRTLTAAAAVAFIASSAAGPGSHGSKNSTTSDSWDPTDPTLPTGRGSLRLIVQNYCIINWTQHRNASPCERVFLEDAKVSNFGYAVLADPGGGAHYLLVPTQTMAGTDSSELLDPDLPNFFAEAWRAHDLITKFVGHEVPRTAIGLAVNTASTRTYDQFHIHIECLRQDVSDSLRASAEQVSDVWSPLSVAGATFQAMRIPGDGLDGSNLFELLAHMKPDTARHLRDYTLFAAGAQFKAGPGFIVLTGTGPTGEFLLDSTCAVAGGGG